jgi:hypothetical protein
MRLRRAVLLAVVLHLTADYCDPSAQGVFFFDTASFFIESLDSRFATRVVLRSETPHLPPFILDTIAPLRYRQTTARDQVRGRRPAYRPRAQIAVASESPPPPPASGNSEDH